MKKRKEFKRGSMVMSEVFDQKLPTVGEDHHWRKTIVVQAPTIPRTAEAA